jgi:hypothetical protein
MSDRIVYAELSFAKPSFLRGLASVLNLGGVGDEPDPFTAEEQDTLAIASDWYAVGEDLRCAFSNLIAADRRQVAPGMPDGR